MTETQLALLGALFGGVGLKVVGDLLNKWLNRGKEQFDEAAAIRAELRTEVQKLRAEIGELRQEAERWKERYYKLLQEYLDLNSRHQIILAELEELREEGPK